MPSTVEKSPVATELERLGKNVEALEVAIARLAERLNPVRVGVEVPKLQGGPGVSQPRPTRGPLVDSLDGANDRFASQLAVIAALENSLQI